MELIARARAGDEHAFRELVEPHRRELHVHCYRMLGSLQDAEDALQETLLAAWHGLDGYEGRASLRTWLYRIATNRCLNARRAADRRPAKAWALDAVPPPEPTGLGEVPWLEPLPDDPADARHERTESISLAFVTALQVLPGSQVAVLVLREVLGFSAAEVAEMLDTTVGSVNSLLKRARAGLRERLPDGPRDDSPGDAAVARRFAEAYEAADLHALLELLTDDVFMSMPPILLEYRGRDVIVPFLGELLANRRRTLVPTRANGQPAFGVYDAAGTGMGLLAIALRDERVSALTRFEPTVLKWFGLPDQLPPDQEN